MSRLTDVIWRAATSLLGAPPQSGFSFPIHALEAGTFTSLDDPALVAFLSGGRATSTGITINEQMAMRNSAINRAVRLVCSSVGMLPCQLFEKIEETYVDDAGETQTRSVAKRAAGHPVDIVLHKRPNLFMTPFDFKTYMMSRAIFDGIAYGYKQYRIDPRAKGGRVLKAIIPLNPHRVEFKLTSSWEPEFFWQSPNGRIRVPWQDMFWFRGPYSADGITGSKLVDVAGEAIGIANQAERSAGTVLRKGALVGGVLEHPKTLTEPAIAQLRQQFEDRHSSPENAGKWIVAEEGMKVAAGSGGSTLKDAQMQETRKFQAEEAARFLDVPRPLLMLDETSWGTGIEQLGLFLITYCLLPWFIQIEEAIWRSLLSEAEQDQYFAKFNEAALLRGSLKDQADFFAKALGSGGGYGWMRQNEVRDKFQLEPVPGGDVLPQPTKKPGGEDEEDGDEGSESNATGGGPNASD